MTLAPVDYCVLALYFACVLGIGWRLRKKVHSSADFLLSGRSVPVWVTSLAFLAANLGAQELIGMSAFGAKYGLMTAHFYWLGAVPAMLFAGLFMMPFYYGSRARSVPEYLKFRFDEKTRSLNAITFAVMTLFSSGISMYVVGLLLQLALGWRFGRSVLMSAAIVLIYISLGGLAGSIYNEVLQFFLIVAGFTPLVILSLRKAGGWSAMSERLPAFMTHTWRFLEDPHQNPMGVEIYGMAIGLGFVLAFGYWCTDFLVIQRAMAAESMSAARRTPVLAALPKMMMPFIVVVPGIVAMSLARMDPGYALPIKFGWIDYDRALTTLMAKLYPPGLVGLGLAALMASLMSGMAANVTACNTVFTYDIYQAYIRRNAPDAHYLSVARWATLFGILFSLATAYVANRYNNIMDLLLLVFGFVNAPLFATFLLGMFWRRATGHGAFFGLLAGTAAATLTHGLTTAEQKGGWIAPLAGFPSTMAQNFWVAIFAWSACFLITILVSLVTSPRSDDDLRGLVYGLTDTPSDDARSWYQRPMPLACAVGAVLLLLNLWFW